MEKKDYREEFMIPGINFQKFPVYALAKSGRLVNFKNIVYPNPTSAKRFTRRKQLVHRSQQAKMFDMLINIGYFQGLGEVVKEMPILIENSKRPKGMSGLFILLDYYFPNVKLAVELDSEYHEGEKAESRDELRDKFLKEAYGITVFRIKNLHLEAVQKNRFHEFTALLKTLTPALEPLPLIFTNDLFDYLKQRKM